MRKLCSCRLLLLNLSVAQVKVLEMLHFLVLILVHHFSARVHCAIWVMQTEGQVDGVVGRVITLYCQIHSDSGDAFSECIANWYIKELNKWREVGGLNRLKGRFVKDKDASTTNTSFTIKELTKNDTDIYFCTLMCKVNGQRRQHHGNGTAIHICDHECIASKIPTTSTPALPELDSEAEDCPLPVPFLALLALKLVVVVTVTASSTCPHS